MKVLVTVRKYPAQTYLMQLLTKPLIKEVKNLINNKKHSEAVFMVLTRGKLHKEVLKDDIYSVDADLLLCEDNARWDITRTNNK